MYIVHTKNGKLTGMTGSIVTEFEAPETYEAKPSLPAQKAVSLALRHVGATLYAWQDAAFEAAYKKQMGPRATYAPKAGLVWFSDEVDLSPRDLRLAYKIDVYALQP